MTITNDIIDGFQEIRYNPALALSYFVKLTEQSSEPTFSISNTNNPFIKALECSAVTTTGFNQEQLMHHRRLYPIVSQTYDDLYYHMSDKDMINAFAYPSQCTFDIRFSLQEVLDKLILDSSVGYKRMVIPRDTQITVLGMAFTLQHPVEIRQMPHSGIQVVYLFNKESPVETLSSNYVSWGIENIGGLQVLRITLNLRQYAISTVESDVQQSQGFVLNATYLDHFFIARAYIQETINSVKNWRELKVTYNPNIYDPTDPTIVLRVSDGNLVASVPSIYTSQGLKGRMRLDVYTTKGEISTDLAQVSSDDFDVKWTSIDKNEINAYSSIPESLKTLVVTSSEFATGGRNPLSYEELRKRVIDNSFGQKKLPVTPNDISNDLADSGYVVRLQLDSITQRTFIATKNLSIPKDSSILTPASATCLTLNTSLENASNAYGAYRNGPRVTLTDKCLYNISGGLLKILNNQEGLNINNQSLVDLAVSISKGQYYYSPFTYVLDSSNDIFDLRAYYMDSPSIKTRSFVAENATSGHQAAISNNYSITRTDSGYVLDMTITGAEETLETAEDDIELQISFKSESQDLIMYKKATYMGLASNDEHWYRFYFNTQYDIDSNHLLDLKDFLGLTSALDARSMLKQKFNIIIAIRNVSKPIGYIDTIGDVYTQTDPNDLSMPITHEIFEIEFGTHMDALWRRSRSVYKDKVYLKRTENKQKIYNENVYKMFAGLPFEIIEIPDGQGGVTTQLRETILHHKGDLMFDENNDPIYEYRIGDIILDSSGQPAIDPAFTDSISRLIDLYLIDGQYYFVNEPVVSLYRKSFTQELVQWITDDLQEYDKRLLEQTKIYFYPRTSSGPIKVYIDSGNSITVASEQKFSIKLSVRKHVYENNSLIKEIEKTTVKLIAQYLASKTIVSVSELQSQLRSIYAQDVLDIIIKAAIFESNGVVTVADDTNRFSIKKKLSVGQDSKTYLQEDIDFSYSVI